MIAHLKGREKAVEELGFRPREAEWIALVALHSGVFLRSQYGRFVGGARSGARRRAKRVVDSLLLNGYAAESEVQGVGRICRLCSRTVYRALGAEHIRHRKDAARPEIVRRLLSLDFVLGDLARAWLPTEPEKVAAFEALGIDRRLLPKRIYGSPKGGRTVRPFGWKMPVAFGDGVAAFVYVDTGGETHDELLSWGAEHAPLWSELAARAIRIELAAVSASPDRLSGASKILGKWKDGGLKGGGGPAGLGVQEAADLDRVERAIATLDEGAMAQWGGLNGAIDLAAELQGRKRAAGLSAPPPLVRPNGVETHLSGLSRQGGGAC